MEKQIVSLDDVLRQYEGRRRDVLLPALWDVQTAFGHISPEAARQISTTLRVPVADIYGVIGFYSLFSEQPQGETVIHVCTSPSCGLAGADDLIRATCDELGIAPGQTTPDGRYTVRETTCLGLCDHAPAALVSQRGNGEHSVAPVHSPGELASHSHKPRTAAVDGVKEVFLQGTQPHRPQTLAEYGDYAALRHALEHMTPERVIETVEESGLVGRGGAAFPTGRKWRFTRGAPGQPRYVVCNADESEPGTFKDRVLMETRPHLLLEGMALSAYAIGAEQCYLFVRGEYPEATAILQRAIDDATAAGFLGERVMGHAFTCRIKIRRGAGAYICGEETALFEAIEGKRGFPRIKPPYPTTHGLFNKPTVVNNVETLCVVPGVIRHGADWFRQWGSQHSTGTKLVSVSGHVNRPGVYEIPFGMSLRALLDEQCKGVRGTLRAVLHGGAAGTFLTPNEIDVPITFEDLRSIGATLGSGAIMVFNDTVDMRDVLRRLGAFFEHESCGKCYPCQLGTQRQMEILNRADAPLPGDRLRLQDIGQTMTVASLCGLGQTAAMAVLSAMDKWPELFDSD